MMVRKKRLPDAAPQKRGRPPTVVCRALILLDTAQIRQDYLKRYKRRKKALEKLEAELQRFTESDETEFQKFLANRCGAEQTCLREVAERLHLEQMRYEKICFLASERGMRKERYCFYLSEKITPESDFWAVLEDDLEAFQEEARLEEEHRKRYQGVESEEDDCSREDDGEDNDFRDLADGLNAAFAQLWGADDEPERESDRDTLKKLYRELCFKYHPDRVGTHDAKMQRLWLTMQAAYQEGDLARLRHLHAGIVIETGTSVLGCAEIDEIIEDMEQCIAQTRAEVRERKQAPFWGFSTWCEKKRRQAEQDIKAEMGRQLFFAERQLQQLETELRRLRSAYKQKPKKKTKHELHREAVTQMQDLFDFES